MKHIIAKIGKGHKGAKDLTWEEAKEAMRFLIEGQATPGQVGAFLMAMRIKTEAIAELAAFTSLARQYVPPLSIPTDEDLVDLPTYGEKHGTYHVMIASAIVATAAGATILIHGVENPSAVSNIPDVLRHLGIPIASNPAELSENLATFRLGYMDLALYHPPLVRLLDLRQEFGVQNLAHQVARMLNPARATSQVIGIAHPPYLDKIIEALGMLGTSRALVFQGVEGFPELSISTETPVRELKQGHIIPLTIRPRDIGLHFGSYQSMTCSALPADVPRPEQEAKLLSQILRNQLRGDHRAWVILNAALLLYAAGKAASLPSAGVMAQQTLDAGLAAEKLSELSAHRGTTRRGFPLQRETVNA